jgi:crotonobetainyl-CoA:carnitine CoA-transferase CaiB-like acyl-CoA transferase
MPETALTTFLTALGGDPHGVEVVGDGALPSVFAVTDLAAASIAAAGLAARDLIAAGHGTGPAVRVDRRLASFWFGMTLRPEGWSLPPAWDAIAGDYQAADGWIRLHTNAPHHRAAAVAVLDVPEEKAAVAQAVARWNKADLETAVVNRGGCAAAMYTTDEWAEHPQGRAVAGEPLIWRESAGGLMPDWAIPRDRPLAGLRVLDVTRVLAGPVATRFLAGLGAQVLRIDPPDWDEPGVVPEVLRGKRAARLDLKSSEGRYQFTGLLREADVLVHGYRSDTLERLGFGQAQRQALRPGLVDVSLDAYGWTGPWRTRRGFDSLVQMSSGIASAGMTRLAKDRPHPLPVQALDHSCGYAMATAALQGLRRRLETGEGTVARLSLARIAALLVSGPEETDGALAPEVPGDSDDAIEQTEWGPARRMRSPLTFDGVPPSWGLPARALGTAEAVWV